MNIVNEEDLLKKTSENNFVHCQLCGKEFYTKTPKKAKYCPECLIKSRRKEFINIISNKDFKILYKQFFPYIKKCTRNYISSDSDLFDFVVEQSLVNIWIRWVAMINNGMTVNELQKITKTELFYCVKYSYYAVIRARDLPPTLHCHNKKIAEEELNVLRLDMPKSSDIDSPDNLIDYIVDSKPPISKILDFKKILNQIMVESILDSDVKAAIIRAELTDINVKTSISEKEKVSLINNQYNLKIDNLKQLKSKAQNGIKKLYNAYSPEIKEILELCDNDFRLDTNSKELKKHYLYNPIKKCVVCNKAFISYKNDALVCSRECAKKRAEQNKLKLRYRNKLNELFSKAYKSNTMEECSIFLSKMEEFIKKL